MANPDKVTALYVQANGLWNHFTGRKKWRITCGECEHVWDEKVPIQEQCSAVCPCCHAQNVWSASLFADRYERHLNH